MINRLILAAFVIIAVGFSGCAKAPENRSEDGTQDGQGGNEPFKVTVKKASIKCEFRTVTLNKLDNNQTEKIEELSSFEGERTTTRISKNTTKRNGERVRKLIYNLIKEDGSKQKKSERNYKSVDDNEVTIEKLENNIYLEVAEQKRFDEALDEASYFKDQNGKKSKTRQTNIKLETKYFDDGEMYRMLELKVNGKNAEIDKGEYKETSTTDENTKATTVITKLKAPWTDSDGNVTDDYVSTCVTTPIAQ